jgi:ribonucleases P/MRP protein subunit RPP25
MQGYKKVEKEKTKTEENEIRVTSKGQIKKYLGYALRVLIKEEIPDLVIRATGNAIVKALILIEIVKRRVGDLHQINAITSAEIVDEFEPQVEGLEKIE